MTRDERQEICRVKWIKSKCRGTIEACTGFGFKFFKNGSRSVLEWTELLSSNIGESPTNEDNTEIIEDIKESSTSYSIENETNELSS